MRINALSPSVIEESPGKYGERFPGFAPVPLADVARAFVKSIEGFHTGQEYSLG